MIIGPLINPFSTLFQGDFVGVKFREFLHSKPQNRTRHFTVKNHHHYK